MAHHPRSTKVNREKPENLYRDMAAGRLSWVPEGDSARRLETSELIRAYGALLPMAQVEDDKTAHGDTPHGTSDTALILAELKALRAEVSELRQAMRLLEHKPDIEPPDTPDTPEIVPIAKPLPWWRRPLFSKNET